VETEVKMNERLRHMSPQDRLRITFQLSDLAKRLTLASLRAQFPAETEAEIEQVVRRRLLDSSKKELSINRRMMKSAATSGRRR
jgi:hypothetical protein